MLKGFRDFLARGNIIELSIAVVVGTAFTALVTAVTRGLLQPLIDIFLGGGVTGGQVHWRGEVFDFGMVINAILTFLIIAAVVYFGVLVPLRRLSRPKPEVPPPAKPEAEEAKVLVQIRDLLARQVEAH